MNHKPAIPQALAAFESLYPRILAVVREKLTLELGRQTGKLNPLQEEILEDGYVRFGETLKAVYSFGLYECLRGEVSWLASVLESRGLGREWGQKILETWTFGIQGLVKPPEAEELSRPLIQAQALIPGTSTVPSSGEQEPPEDVQKYLDLAFGNKRKEAAEFALAFLELGRTPEKIADALLIPALRQIGVLWEKNKIGAAAEHQATEITRYVIYRLFDTLPRKKPVSLSAVLACVPGDEHDIGIDLMANLLAGEGWSAVLIGRGAPQFDLLEAVGRLRPDVIFLSVSLLSQLPAAHSLILDLRAKSPGSVIILGGAAALKAKAFLAPIVSGIAGSLEDGRRMALSLVKAHA